MAWRSRTSGLYGVRFAINGKHGQGLAPFVCSVKIEKIVGKLYPHIFREHRHALLCYAGSNYFISPMTHVRSIDVFSSWPIYSCSVRRRKRLTFFISLSCRNNNEHFHRMRKTYCLIYEKMNWGTGVQNKFFSRI